MTYQPTPDDVTAGLAAITGAGWESDMLAILTAAGPAIYERGRRDALTEAANDATAGIGEALMPLQRIVVSAWLLARAEGEQG
jgi:hypothetical protein